VLSEMCEAVRAKVRRPDPYRVVPHMSLFYGKLTAEQRGFVETEVTVPPIVSFDLISAIANPPQVASPEDVEYWYEVDRSRLCTLP
jgi:hypothetical protein